MTQHNRMKLRLVASRLHSNDAGQGWYQASYSETSCNFLKAGLPPMTDILIQMNLCREDGLCQASQAAVVLPVARWREKSRTN